MKQQPEDNDAETGYGALASILIISGLTAAAIGIVYITIRVVTS